MLCISGGSPGTARPSSTWRKRGVAAAENAVPKPGGGRCSCSNPWLHVVRMGRSSGSQSYSNTGHQFVAWSGFLPSLSSFPKPFWDHLGVGFHLKSSFSKGAPSTSFLPMWQLFDLISVSKRRVSGTPGPLRGFHPRRYTGDPKRFWCPSCRFRAMDPFNEAGNGSFNGFVDMAVGQE